MSAEDNLGVTCLLCAGLIAILVCIGIGCALQDGPSYKRGQLDYQAGKIEWTVIEGKVHHIEAKHE